MNPKTFVPLVVSLLALIAASCEPELVTNIDMPQEDPKIVINAYLEAGLDQHQVFIGKSTPNNVTGDDQWFLADAEVRVSDGIHTVTLQHDSDGYYSFKDQDLPVLTGKRYTISAKAPGYPKEATGSCTIPAEFDPRLEILSIDSALNEDYKTYNIKARFQDAQGTADFYRIVPKGLMVSELMPDTMKWYLYSSGSQPLLFDDTGKDGQWITFSFQADLYKGEGSLERLIGTELILFRTDEAYYKFHLPFENGTYYNDSPFGEPTIIYTNITNGYGVISGLLRYTLTQYL